ncbi:uncharacterized protein EI90DRAFT_2978648 [Cantharellus anzutake]|uniref:uncharacterized protein n=1 Tax=Cantharellus anzutake TaxID=1750568 RepID=UPI0019086D86|nr:uncharacterized protein EI90DRAFT_2978648 [Cantharellus anzutake]KAF8319144.1 hypothetical protein EI90DRAFT_2978648 [Cantharellus anzutake]
MDASIGSDISCPLFVEKGRCPYGYKCRFLGGHVEKAMDREGLLPFAEAGSLVTSARASIEEINTVGASLFKSLRSRQFSTPKADGYFKQPEETATPAIDASDKQLNDASEAASAQSFKQNLLTTTAESSDTPDVPFKPREKTRLNWTGLTYLAPLTTVGNLPFRRLAVSLGADITCSEMVLSGSLLQGSREEWSLVRRHPSERVFGVQVAGSKAVPLARCAEVLAEELGSGENPGIDFIDVNCGCPIDLVFQTGAGAALLDAPGKLGKIIRAMNHSIGAIPLTIKARTGVKDGKNTTHKLMSRVGGWGVSAMTIHGRTRQQRYTKMADWNYIRECVEALREHTKDNDFSPIPIFGGGDVFSSQAYWDCLEKYGIDGVMIGRGALIKPWLFTEIKERREWDISARERLDLIRQYVDHGLNHWGSDTMGVNTTRRFLCEALSFQHRYIPVGLLEVMPGRINDRPPRFRGRNELETLLASTQVTDWIKISEMFLGPVPENWTFIPKHKSNAVEGNG